MKRYNKTSNAQDKNNFLICTYRKLQIIFLYLELYKKCCNFEEFNMQFCKWHNKIDGVSSTKMHCIGIKMNCLYIISFLMNEFYIQTHK